MKKKKTPLITIVLYITGVLFLLMALFMLVTAISYTKAYLQSYDAAFADMWSNSIQYVIAQFGPYMGVGVVALGLGKTIKELRKSQDTGTRNGIAGRSTAYGDRVETQLKNDDLMHEVEAVREVISIKIEEKEKRDSYRLGELERKLESLIAAYAAAVEDEKTPVSHFDDTEVIEEVIEAEESQPAGPVPQLFRAMGSMTMPDIPRFGTETEEMGFDAFAKRDAKRDTFSKNELRAALAREEAFQKAKKAEIEKLESAAAEINSSEGKGQ